VDRIFPGHAVTPKSRGNPHGTGKGSPEKWVAVVQDWRIMLKWRAWTKSNGGQLGNRSHKLRFHEHSSPAKAGSAYGAAFEKFAKTAQRNCRRARRI